MNRSSTRDTQTISYEIREGGEPTVERTVNRGNGTCLATGSAIPGNYIKSESRAERMGQQLIAVVAEGERGRRYCSVDSVDADAAICNEPPWKPQGRNPKKLTGGTVYVYGLDEWWKLFSARQLVALTTFSDLLVEVREQILADAAAAGLADDGEGAAAYADTAAAAGLADDGMGLRDGGQGSVAYADAAAAGLAGDEMGLRDGGRGSVADAVAAGLADDGMGLRDGGRGAAAYADAVVTYLAFAVDRLVDRNCTICSWDSSRQHARNVFARQAIPMSWDYTENNPIGPSSGSWKNCISGIARALEHLPASSVGGAQQRDAQARVEECSGAVLSTDPPYYDNISYADLSDFFYVWLRRNLGDVWPVECSTLLTPKAEELIANRYRAGSKEEAEDHFESGMAGFMAQVAQSQRVDVPATIYYAYKATETKDGEVRTTGWDTFLQAVLDAGLQVNATWPMRTELGNRLVASKSNALASSIVLACRPRAVSASLATRAEFIAALRNELPEAVRLLQSGNIAPVDMAQSTIGPGIKVFSRYARVVEADGSAMSVSVALGIINDVLGEILDGEEAELDTDSRFALSWFSQHGYDPGPSGDADSVARAKNTSLAGIEQSGIGEARQGRFRLFERHELDPGWSPLDDDRLTVWEVLQYLVAALERSESEAAELLHQLGGNADRARQLAYVLYAKANDNRWTTEAGAYNALITAWPTLTTTTTAGASRQQTLL